MISAPLSVREAGFSLHAAARAGAADKQGREALLKYILRPPLSTERLLPGPDGLVRIALKKPFSDGTWRSTWTRSHCSAASSLSSASFRRATRRLRAWPALRCRPLGRRKRAALARSVMTAKRRMRRPQSARAARSARQPRPTQHVRVEQERVERDRRNRRKELHRGDSEHRHRDVKEKCVRVREPTVDDLEVEHGRHAGNSGERGFMLALGACLRACSRARRCGVPSCLVRSVRAARGWLRFERGRASRGSVAARPIVPRRTERRGCGRI